jgi:hypothetical protein
LFPWDYETRFANFHQGLSPEQKVEGFAVSDAVAAAVFRADEHESVQCSVFHIACFVFRET